MDQAATVASAAQGEVRTGRAGEIEATTVHRRGEQRFGSGPERRAARLKLVSAVAA